MSALIPMPRRISGLSAGVKLLRCDECSQDANFSGQDGARKDLKDAKSVSAQICNNELISR